MKELIKDLSKVVRKAIENTLEDNYFMDFECEGVEPTLNAESYQDSISTDANVYIDMLWSSGARPNDKKARSYVDVAIDTMEREMDELVAEGKSEEDAYLLVLENNREYDPFIEVVCKPRYFRRKEGFEVCDLTISMTMFSYNGAKIAEYEPKLISFTTISNQEDINPNYVSEDDFEFEQGGYPVEEEIIERFIQDTIQEYVAQF